MESVLASKSGRGQAILRDCGGVLETFPSDGRKLEEGVLKKKGSPEDPRLPF